jgi:hypothetical protein
MKALKITIGALGVVAMLAIPATTMAAPLESPTSFDTVMKDNTVDHSNPIAQGSSQITHNGWFVSGNKNSMNYDQTTGPGSRAEIVQQTLGHTS